MDLVATVGISIMLICGCRARAIYNRPATSDYREALLDIFTIMSSLMIGAVTLKIIQYFCKDALPQFAMYFLPSVGKTIYLSIRYRIELNEVLI
jgi:hypothetical protein